MAQAAVRSVIQPVSKKVGDSGKEREAGEEANSMIHDREHIEYGFVLGILPILLWGGCAYELHMFGWLWEGLAIAILIGVAGGFFAARSFYRIENPKR